MASVYENLLRQINQLENEINSLKIVEGAGAAGGGITGSGITNRIAQWSGAASLTSSTLIKTGVGVLTIDSDTDYTLTVPGTGTVLLEATAATTYLKLDASNDPITGALSITSTRGATNLALTGQQTIDGDIISVSGSDNALLTVDAYAYDGGAGSQWMAQFNRTHSVSGETTPSQIGGIYTAHYHTHAHTLDDWRGGEFGALFVTGGGTVNNSWGTVHSLPTVTSGSVGTAAAIYIPSHSVTGITTPYAIYSPGPLSSYFGAGTINIEDAPVPIEAWRSGGTSSFRFSVYTNSTTNGGRIVLRGAAGTQSSPGDVANNYVLGEVQFHGYVNSAFRQFAVIRTSAVSTISSTSYPTNMYFITTPQGSTTNTVMMTIHNSGYVGINTSTGTPRGMLGVIARAATDVVSSFKGASSQSADLMRWENASNVTMSLVDANGGMVINENGGASADFRVEGDTETNMIFNDASADQVFLGGTTNGIQIDKGGALTLIGTAVYERHVQLVPNIYGNPSTAPTTDAIGTAGAAIFTTSGSHYTYLQFEIPNDWNGADMYIEADMTAVAAISGTDTIKLDLSYRSIAEGEAITNGTVATSSITDSSDYTLEQTKHQRFTLTYNHADQPLTAQDHVYASFTRDTSVANDAAASIGITAFELIYTSKGIPDSN